MFYLANFRRLLLISLLATWWGGFTFYSLAVIPSGHEVLHSSLRQGFITQSVTKKLNWLGAITLAVALTEGWGMLERRKYARLFLASWLICTASQATLFYLHTRLDAMLVPAESSVTDEGSFESIHRYYVCTATVGWVAAAVMLGMVASPQVQANPRPPSIARISHEDA